MTLGGIRKVLVRLGAHRLSVRSVSWWSRRVSPRAQKTKWGLRPADWFVSGPKRSWVASSTTWRTWPASCSRATTSVTSPWLRSLLWPEHPQVRSHDCGVMTGACVCLWNSLCTVHQSWLHDLNVFFFEEGHVRSGKIWAIAFQKFCLVELQQLIDLAMKKKIINGYFDK